MRFAIVESGGKQYRAVEGSTIDVDRLVQEPGKKFNLERVLLMADGDTFMVGTPAVNGIQVTATVVEHFKGPKVVSFKYRPKKRIRVKGGHRHHYTRLLIDFIGKPGEDRMVEKPAARKELIQTAVEPAPRIEKQPKAPKKESVKVSTKKTEKKSTSARPSSKPAARKTDSKKK